MSFSNIRSIRGKGEWADSVYLSPFTLLLPGILIPFLPLLPTFFMGLGWNLKTLGHAAKVPTAIVVEKLRHNWNTGGVLDNRLYTSYTVCAVFEISDGISYIFRLSVAYLPRIRYFNIILKPRWCDWADHTSSQTHTHDPHEYLSPERVLGPLAARGPWSSPFQHPL